jgi:hypothetical protein
MGQTILGQGEKAVNGQKPRPSIPKYRLSEPGQTPQLSIPQ